jgi:hypothetical protein
MKSAGEKMAQRISLRFIPAYCKRDGRIVLIKTKRNEYGWIERQERVPKIIFVG